MHYHAMLYDSDLLGALLVFAIQHASFLSNMGDSLATETAYHTPYLGKTVKE